MVEARTFRFEGSGSVELVADVFGHSADDAVILAHGGGQTRHSWSGAASRLAEAGWQAVALDLRGHGESGWSLGGDYGIDRFAEDLVAVAQRFPGPPHLIGASLGGLAGLAALTRIDPRAFCSLTLVDIVPRNDPAGVAKIMGFMSANVQDGFDSLEAAADAIAAYLPHRPKPKDLSGLAKNLRRGEDGRYRWHWDPAFVTGVMRGRSPDDIDRFQERLGEIVIPVHLIRGRMSELVSKEAADDFLRQVPHAVLTDVAGAAHMVAGDRNDVFAAAVLDFLERLRTSPAALD